MTVAVLVPSTAATVMGSSPFEVEALVRSVVRNQPGWRVLLHEVLDLVALVDDQVALVLLDDVFDGSRFVTRHDGKSIALAPDAIVLRQRHQHPALAPAGFPTLALELEALLTVGPLARALIKSSDPIVHRAHQVFIPGLPLEALLHAPDPNDGTRTRSSRSHWPVPPAPIHPRKHE